MPAEPATIRVAAAAGARRGTAEIVGRRVPCALGRSGIRRDKREGDGATPAGGFRLVRVYFRPDRLARPETGLPVTAITPDLGWCDDPGDPTRYNRPVTLPYPGSHERMWRDDHLYDLVVEIDHNSDPPVPGLGSAVFLHLARDDWGPTEGCVAFLPDDLLEIVRNADPSHRISIEPA